MIRGLRGRLHQARQPLPSEAFHNDDDDAQSSVLDGRCSGGVDDASEPCWHLRDDALSEADSLEIVQGLERQLDCIRDSLASCSNSLSEEQVCFPSSTQKHSGLASLISIFCFKDLRAVGMIFESKSSKMC